MKYLSQFLKFDFESFSAKKAYLALNCSPWIDYDSKQKLGTRIEAVIYRDETPYRQKDGEKGDNRFEKIVFKVSRDISLPENVFIQPVNATASIYGEYRNQISVKCSDIKVIQPSSK